MPNFLKIFVSFLLVSYLVYIFDFNQLDNIDYKVIYLLIFSVIAWVVAFYFMALRWNLISQVNGIKTKLKKLYHFYWIGSFFNIFFPGGIGGDTVRIKYFSDFTNIGLTKSTAIVLKERIFGLVGLFLVLIVGLSYSIDDVLNSTVNINSINILLTLGIFAVAIFFFFLRKKYGITIQQFFYLTLLSICGQFADIIIVYMFINYFEISIDFTNLLFIMPLIYFATVLPISLGGIGVREGAFVALMTIFGVESSIAILISFLLYFSKILIGLIGMIIYLKYKNERVEI